MATPTIPNGEEHFFVTKYEGNSAGQRVGKFVPFTDSGTIANSVIFATDDTASLTKTFSGAGDRTEWTWSAWIKKGKPDESGILFYASPASDAWNSSSSGGLYFATDNKLYFYNAGTNLFVTSRTFEDSSKWYHLLLAYDSSQSGADKVKFYVDGEQVTSFSTDNRSSAPASSVVNDAQIHMIGGQPTTSTANAFWDGYFAEVNFVDGQALTPASFGLTDTSTGRWIPKTVSPYPTTTTTFTVTVADASGNKYFIDSSQQATVTLIEGATYRFDQSDSSNAGHPLRFSTTSNGTHASGVEFTSGVTTAGTPGSSGAYTEITVPTGTATLYYYCTNHSGMGGQANTQDQYGTNGFRLTFSDSSNFGTDTSGKSNTFTATNLSASSQTTDSPTSNHATFDPNFSSSSMVLSEGNLKVTDNANNNYESAYVGMPVQSGKYYFEVTLDVAPTYMFLGVNTLSAVTANKNQYPGYADGSASYLLFPSGSGDYVYYGGNGNNYINPGVTTSLSNGDKLGVAYDADTGAFWVAKNNTWINSGNPSTGANPQFSGFTSGQLVYFSVASWFSGKQYSFNFGQRSFAYTPPTGFVALQQDNMPETAKGITGFTWIKDRDNALNHNSYDSSNGVFNRLVPNASSAILNTQGGVSKFLKGGIVVGDTSNVNNSGASMVSWNWVANGGVSSTNNDGSITSTVQANSDAGFSIVKWTGTGSNATVGHGLSTAPSFILGKVLTTTDNWIVGHHKISSTPWNNAIFLNSNSSIYTNSAYWNNTAPTSSVFTTGTWWYNSQDYVAYCWHEIEGFSKFGSYSGNGSVDGCMIYTGFTPSWLMIKRTDSSTGGNWSIIDSTRYPTNPIGAPLLADDSGAESGLSAITMDLLSNGFKIRNTLNSNNASGASYIYMAFASHSFLGDGTSPVTAR